MVKINLDIFSAEELRVALKQAGQVVRPGSRGGMRQTKEQTVERVREILDSIDKVTYNERYRLEEVLLGMHRDSMPKLAS